MWRRRIDNVEREYLNLKQEFLIQPIVMHLEREFEEIKRDLLLEPLTRNLGWENEKLEQERTVWLMLLHLERETEELDAAVKALASRLKSDIEELKLTETTDVVLLKDVDAVKSGEVKEERLVRMVKKRKQNRLRIPWR